MATATASVDLWRAVSYVVLSRWLWLQLLRVLTWAELYHMLFTLDGYGSSDCECWPVQGCIISGHILLFTLDNYGSSDCECLPDQSCIISGHILLFTIDGYGSSDCEVWPVQGCIISGHILLFTLDGYGSSDCECWPVSYQVTFCCLL